jgi:hypothetical protein
MKLTQNRVRLLGGIATALGGIALLTGIWPHVGALYPFSHQGNLDPSGVTGTRVSIIEPSPFLANESQWGSDFGRR